MYEMRTSGVGRMGRDGGDLSHGVSRIGDRGARTAPI